MQIQFKSWGFKHANLITAHTISDKKLIFLDFQLSPCSECCILSFVWLPGV